MENMGSTFLQLPPELIEAIAAATEGSDLLALRLTSTEVAKNVDKIFVQRYFTHRRHLITRASFEALLNITGSQRLCRKLKTIELVVTNVSPSVVRSTPHGVAACLQDDCQRAIWSSWDSEPEGEFNGRSDVAMLAGSLANLARVGVIPELKVCTHSHFSPVSYGFRQLVEHLSSTGKSSIKNEFLLLGRSPDDNGETASLLLSAIAQAQFPVRTLCLSDKKAPLSHGSMTRIAKSVKSLSSALSQLESLAVSLGCVHNLTLQDIITMAEITRSMPLLRKLSLEFSENCCRVQKSFLPPSILGVFTASALEEIHLTGAILRQQDLCAFLARHQDSLRALTLRHVSIGPWDKFAAVFDWMQQTLHLDTLVLHWLRQGYDHMDEAIGRGSQYSFNGRAEVVAGLQELSRSVTFGDPPTHAFQPVEQKPAVQAMVA
ncbi:hypothetical protein CKM354_000547100 [Cercospora kikuchii]|uniref:F-box domain-containing protein n=1 Tax=Cercospora kikuchii TaxID=84275 RepID=A0A9P3CPN8_9PEZI|nr:uncharacterized protein CKM354_000547100 [Cercospora kikuchii]GIZ42193.1 hypothetical protein CKM354_000547100 [Cercospora kikuchii]